MVKKVLMRLIGCCIALCNVANATCEKEKVIIVSVTGHQGGEYFDLLKNRLNFVALVDADDRGLQKSWRHQQVPLFKDVTQTIGVQYDVAIVCVPHKFHASTVI
ncbi:MAG: hypothetical protein LBT03_01140 [Holosporales bacterium]|jgi:N-acetyl-gamma-glutamylphosphate reductase|nr:hypothetical protein [Holosporales bacterium]